MLTNTFVSIIVSVGRQRKISVTENVANAVLSDADMGTVNSVSDGIVSITMNKSGSTKLILLDKNFSKVGEITIVALNYSDNTDNLIAIMEDLEGYQNLRRHHGDGVQESLERLWREMYHLISINKDIIAGNLELQQKLDTLTDFINENITLIVNEYLEDLTPIIMEKVEKLVKELTSDKMKELEKRVDDAIANMKKELSDKFAEFEKKYREELERLNMLTSEGVNGIPYLNQTILNGHEQTPIDMVNNFNLVVTLQPRLNGITQAFNQDQETARWFCSQYKDFSGTEGTVWSEMAPDGSYISNMVVKNSGHGSILVMLRSDERGRPVILTIDEDKQLYWFKYQPGTTIDRKSGSGTHTLNVPNGLTAYDVAWLPESGIGEDKEKGYLFLTDGNSANRNKITRFKATWNRNNMTMEFGTKHQINMPEYVTDGQAGQGIAFLSEADITGVDKTKDTGVYYMFKMTGDGVGESSPRGVPYIRADAKIYASKINMLTGEAKFIKSLDHIEDVINPISRDHAEFISHEPQSLLNLISPTPSIGSPYASSLTFAMIGGSAANRPTHIYSCASPRFITNENALATAYTKTHTTVSNQNFTGDYLHQMTRAPKIYFTVDEMRKMKDAPYMFRNKSYGLSWTLENSTFTSDLKVTQVLTLQTSGGAYKWERTINYWHDHVGVDSNKYEVGKWGRIKIALPTRQNLLSGTNGWSISEPGSTVYLTGTEMNAAFPEIFAKYPSGGFVTVLDSTTASQDVRQEVHLLDGRILSRSLHTTGDDWSGVGPIDKSTAWRDAMGGTL